MPDDSAMARRPDRGTSVYSEPVTVPAPSLTDRILRAVDDLSGDVIDFTRALLRVPTVNPPGEGYAECARLIGDQLRRCGFEVDYVVADGRPEHSSRYPRVNVVGTRGTSFARPAIHLNGHFDVVPVGDGWTVPPFEGLVRDGRIYGRGACDMKAGLAAAIFAAEALRRADVRIGGRIDISGTVDEESGGWAGAAWLAERTVTSASTDYVIIPEPLNVDRICIGHRGVYWFDVTTRGRIAHGSMPFLGVSAIEHMGEVLHAVRTELQPALAGRHTAMPVVPAGARQATINTNGVIGGQPVEAVQSPCVADSCHATFDRRFLLEEGFEATRAEVVALLDGVATRVPQFRYELTDRMVVHPVQTPLDSPLIGTMDRIITDVLGAPPALVASPGTYDHKHFTRLGGIAHCVAYGPGILELAHQPDEYCAIADLINATRVLALTVHALVGAP